MLRLLLLRHAKAERSKPGTRDHERELTDRGRSDAATIGSYLMHHALVPSLALVSSSARTRETWKHTAKAFPNTPPVRYEDDLYDAGPKRILRIVKDVEPEAMTLLVIGHNPGLHELANLLVASGGAEARRWLAEEFPTAALAVIDHSIDDWSRLSPHAGRLIRFVTPKSLAAKTD